MKRRWKVLLCGYYGMGNLGDELLASASIRLLENCGISRDQIAMLSGNPEDSLCTHKITAIDRWDMKKIYSALRNSESLLLGGGGIFQDSSSFRSPWYYWLIVRSAKIAGCSVWAVGQSIGPLSHFLNRLLTYDAFHCCTAISVRDAHSYKFLSEIFAPGGQRTAQHTIKCLLTDDLVLSFQKENSLMGPQIRVSHNENANYFLVNFRPSRDKLEYKAAESLKNLQISPELKIVGIAMDKNDVKLMEELASKKLLALDELFTPGIENVEEIFSHARAGFGMRLHFGVLCLKAGIPFALVPYDPKVSDFARRWDVPLWPEEKINWHEPCVDAKSIFGIQKKIHDDFSACFEKVKDARLW